MDTESKRVETGKQRILIGGLVELDLGEGNFAYGRIVSKSELAFYDGLVNGPASSYEAIYTQPIAFIVSVMNSAVRSRRWKIVDQRLLKPELARERQYFMQDILTGQYSIYYSVTGEIHPSCKEMCMNLERAAVWDAQHMEARLRKHFATHR
ncbi:hypothetical protein GCM10027317_27370 [Massilia agri]